MAKQTINIGASPNDGTGTPLRTAFDYTNQNFTELYTALGGGVGLPGAITQVLFNNGTNVAGDAGLVYNSTTDALTIGGNVQAASATITGAATVGTTLGVTGVSTLTGNVFANGSATVAGGTPGAFANAALTINNRGGVSDLSLISLGYRPNGTILNGAAYIGFITTSGAGNVLGDLIFGTRSVTTDTAPTERYRIDSTGVATWSNVGGVAGTAMTLNATGLGVGLAPANDKLLVSQTIGLVTSTTSDVNFRNIGNTTIQRIRYDDSTGTLTIGSALGTAYPVQIGGNTTTRAVTIDGSSNVGIGVTPSAGKGCLQLSSGITFPATQVASADANTLDDYEEGTWTIGLTFGGGSTGITTSANTGRYTKVGRQVTVIGYLALTNKGSSTGSAAITGLPFTSPNSLDAFAAATLRFTAVSYTGTIQGIQLINSTKIELDNISDAGVVSSLTDSNFANSSSIIISCTYTV